MRIGVGMATAGLVFGLVACSDSAAPATDDLVGTWNATAAEFVREADPSESVEIIAQGGSFRITLGANGTWSAIVTAPQITPDTSGGTWTASTDVLTLITTGQAGETQFDYVLSGTTITLTDGHVTWDYGNGDEAARLNITATKQ